MSSMVAARRPFCAKTALAASRIASRRAAFSRVRRSVRLMIDDRWSQEDHESGFVSSSGAADTPRAPHRPAHCSGTTSGSTMALGGPAEVRVPTLALSLVSVAAALALVSLGGGLYEFLVVDPFWPRRPEIIQPARGGISRKR